MQVLQALARRTVVKMNPRRVNKMISSWEICREQNLGITQKDFPIFQRLVTEEMKQNPTLAIGSSIRLVQQSDSEPDEVFSSDSDEEAKPSGALRKKQTPDEFPPQEFPSPGFPSQIPSPSKS